MMGGRDIRDARETCLPAESGQLASYDTGLACAVGIAPARVFAVLKANVSATGLRCSVADIAEAVPELSQTQTRRALGKLLEAGLLVRVFTQGDLDRTPTWFLNTPNLAAESPRIESRRLQVASA